MRSPRRDAIEYGILLTLGTLTTMAYGVMVYHYYVPDEDGKTRTLGKRVDLNAPIFGQGGLFGNSGSGGSSQQEQGGGRGNNLTGGFGGSWRKS
mmetsp:Transcript_7059/g.9392  ORF Transcript_7059/g.9392 Transcript_7059/m.9392 type:complete len:94 (-) Transcript_7059:267-548(-)